MLKRSKIAAGVFFASYVVFLAGFFVRPAAASTEISNAIFSDQTWDLAGSPYIIKGGNAGVGGGATLTIEPGVVVKLEENVQFSAGSGSIRALGLPGQPIIFTSIFDDSVDGDTNGDGGVTTPYPGAWYRMVLGNDNNLLDHVEVKYGAYCMLASFSKPTITHSLFEHCGTGFDFSHLSAGTTMTDNTIRNNYYGVQALVPFPDGVIFSNNNITSNAVGFRNVLGSSGPSFDARGNWWGHASGPFNTSFNPQGQGNEVTDYVLFDPWLESEVASEPALTKRPVLIVPGILGTEMKSGDELLWADISRMLNPFDSDSFMDPLQFNTNSVPLDVSIVVDKVIGIEPFFDYSDGLVGELKDQGYNDETLGEHSNLFLFPYDWRYGATGQDDSDEEVNVKALKDKIQAILSQTGFDKLDIIAHSTGGLLAKKYIMENPDNHGINKAVFVGVPNLGAPKAAKVLLQGDDFNVTGLNAEEMKTIGTNMPIAYDLAPSPTYFDLKGSFLRTIDHEYLQQEVITDLDYQAAWDLLFLRGANITGFTNSQPLHIPNFENFDLRTVGIDAYNIVGCKSGTIGQTVERRTVDINGGVHITYDGPEIINGDATVPYESANSNLTDEGKTYYATKSNHGKMLSADGTRQLITNLVSGSNLDTGNRIITRSELLANPRLCKLRGTEIKVLSPLDIEVIDGARNRSGVAEDGSIQNDIPGAEYEVFGDHKFVYLPDGDGEAYTINLKGTGSGTFTLKKENFEDDQTTGSENFINIPVSPQLRGVVLFKAGTTMLNLDTNGDGGTDEVIEPSSVIDGDESQDMIAPRTEAVVSGQQGIPGFYRSDVKVSLTSVDPIISGRENETSGTLSTYFSLDNGPFAEYDSAVIVSTKGPHTIQFYSTDRAGNNEATKTLNLHIDKSAPEIQTQFDLTLKDFVFQTTDNLDPDPVISCTQTSCTATDDAGNTTILSFQKTKILTARNLKLVSISYNGTVSSFQPNLLVINLVEKSGSLLDFDQGFWLKSKQVVYIDLNKPKNQSTIYTLKSNGTLTKEVVSGMRFLQIVINQGMLETKVKP